MNKKRQRQSVGGDNGFEQWGGYMSAKKSKLQDQFKEQVNKDDQEKDNIFTNVSIFVNGYTVPSADDLKRIMMVHGGNYHHYFSTDRTTHIIASNLPDVKIKQLKSLHVRVVKPEWITACLDAGRQVDYRPYLLYSHQSSKQPSIVDYGETSKANADGPCVLASSKNCNDNKVPSNLTEEPDLFDDEDEPLQSTSVSFDNNDYAAVSSVNNNCATSSSTDSSITSKKSLIKARCATEPNFLSEFYGNSRLHHISTMGAMFKRYVNELRLNNTGNFPGRILLQKWKLAHPVNTNYERGSLLDDDDEDFVKSSIQSPHSMNSSKVIMHIDMDCFFVSVGLRKHPDLKGKPVAVTHSKGGSQQVPSKKGADRKFEINYHKQKLLEKSKKSSKNTSRFVEESPEDADPRIDWINSINDADSMAEIASCSYEARNKGVRNGMFMGTALKLCPDLKVIPYDFEGYKEVAYTLYNTVASYTLDIEAVSCDEMFVDCTHVLKETRCSPLEFAACLREEIKEKTDCPASTGFGANRLLSRLATRKAKPDGMFHLKSASVEEFMKTVKVNDLPGVGYAMATRLKAMNIITCGDLQKVPLTKLREFGNKTGEALFEHCRGRDDRPLNFAHQRKSVSAEVNYGVRFKANQEAEIFFSQLASELQTRLLEVNMKGRCITLKLMVRAQNAPMETAKFMGHGVCDNISRSSTLSNAICDSDSILREVLAIFKKVDVNASDLRGIGIQISRLENVSSVRNCNGAFKKFFTTPHQNSSSVPCRSVEQNIELSEKKSGPEGCLVAIDTKIVNKPSNPIKTTKGVQGIDKFMVSRKKSTRKDNVSKLPSPSDLDLAVFSALPEDIRNEILAEYSLQKGTEAKKASNFPSEHLKKESNEQAMNVSLSQVDPTFLDALPIDVRDELTADLYLRKEQKTNQNWEDMLREKKRNITTKPIDGLCRRGKSILSDTLSAREVRDMIQRWVFYESSPLPCDTHMLKHYFLDLVVSKRIDDLYTIIRGFHRCVSKRLERVWVEEYENIISSVQTQMEEVYHSRLQVEEHIAIPSCSKDEP